MHVRYAFLRSFRDSEYEWHEYTSKTSARLNFSARWLFPPVLATRIKALWPGTRCSWESWGKMPPAGCVPRESDDKPVLFEPMMKSVLLVRVVTSVPSRHFCIPTSFWGCLLIWDVLRRGIQENDPKHLPWEKPCGFQNITFGLIYWNMHGSCFKGTPQSVPKRLASQT